MGLKKYLKSAPLLFLIAGITLYALVSDAIEDIPVEPASKLGDLSLQEENAASELKEGEADRKPASLPLEKYEIELSGKRNFQKLSLFSEKLLGGFGGESRLVKKMITQDKVVYELNVSQDLASVKEVLLSIQKSLPGLSLVEVQGEKILLELK